MDRQAAYRLVTMERLRQEELKRAGKFLYTCADGGLSQFECFAVLSEEIGEVAGACLQAAKLNSDRPSSVILEELVQVAAVAIAWIESFAEEAASL